MNAMPIPTEQVDSGSPRDMMRTIVRGAYDVQKLRIQMGNRIVGNFKVKLGIEPGTKEDESDKKAQSILTDLRARYKKITDGVATFPRQATFTGDGVISTYTELCLLAQYISLEDSESHHFQRLGHILKEHAIWVAFLDGVKGIGPAMAGCIISEIDIAKAKYASSRWAYAGLDVAQDGRGRSRRDEHLVECEYINKDGESKTRRGITFNPFLKTKLTGVLGPSFLRAGDNKYADIYNAYKVRLENHAVYGIANETARKEEMGGKYSPKLHRHNMAIRYMVKMFLVDLYKAWRALEGLPVYEPYAEAKLGLVHETSKA
jgi:hypothetical protein